ncbi:phosphate transport system permease protein [Anaerocolumna jejuensis DSM 15929]|uniref:Phosphate transport system permease protein PstA n=1 Tax=Anaerocolumna jejuensis DSM 15929 TaxID=1121322 RepID=A0A1M6VDE1_9FIRM|nr:phosphate ABC transporter permease PstA [Anaerocolumna jejuensis]SHK79384.1 phosphate transport system permease protein [Anaerocolumna jejuensis DSM 15929]
MNNNNWSNRKVKDGLLRSLIYLATALTVSILFIIIGFILYKGVPGINVDFLTRSWDDKTTFVNIKADAGRTGEGEEGYIPALGITVKEGDKNLVISKIEKNSPAKKAVNMKNASYVLKKDDTISKIGSDNTEDLSFGDAVKLLKDSDGSLRLKVTRPGGGIIPMFVSTIYIILLSLVVAGPIGISAAIYLNEYAKPGRVLNIIRFAIQNLAGIPSIIYGLFGMLLFVQTLKMQYSILAGSLTLSILLLPTIISTTEEALKEIPRSYREGSYGLGATKLQTIAKIILPGALPGILVAVILSIGRIVGESAALIFTAGTIAQIPEGLVGGKASAATLTTKMYWLIKESGDLSAASSIAVVLLVLIILLNVASKMITRAFLKRTGNG